jgi:hypothetical protein
MSRIEHDHAAFFLFVLLSMSILPRIVRLEGREGGIMRFVLIAMLAFVVLPCGARAQERATDNTLKLAEGQSGAPATLADIELLSGSWTGTGLGGVSEEIWSKPAGGVMMGMYRLIKEEKPVFYEMLWAMEQNGTLIMRLKHFHPNLVGWEEKDKTVDFKFVKKEGRRVYFSGLTFDFVNSKELTIYLALRQKDGTVKEEIFKMKRNR